MNIMTNNKKKRQTSSKEILVQIKENDKRLYEYIENSKKMLEIRAKDNVKLKSQIVREAGEIMAQNREKKTGICADLKQLYKGYIGPATIQYACEPEWKGKGYNITGANQYTIVTQTGEAKIRFSEDSNRQPKEDDVDFISEEEKQYVKAFESEYKTNRQIIDFIEYWTGLNHTEQGGIMLKVEKGGDWRQALVEAGHENILKLAKQSTNSHLSWIQATVRTLKRVLTDVEDTFYEEQELRESKKEMSGV